MTFACLLYLADRDEQAEFLWQFAAGAGKPASAECLHLLYITRGELRHARHWAYQASALDAGESRPGHSAPDPRSEPAPLNSLMFLRALRILRRPDAAITAERWNTECFYIQAGTLSGPLTAAVQSLTAEATAEADALLWPDLALADQLHECRAS
ncbi:hypothetical protein [Streptomyces natalensis]|uniref:hypothetical protein n=1 Tax=Streptomyces natalensis TaxID=68242 RepID=UPI000A879FB7